MHRSTQLVYCCDWADVTTLAARHPKTLSYGLAEGADIRLSDLRLSEDGTSFCLEQQGRRHQVKLAVIGEHNALNAAAALAAAQVAGLPLAEAIGALEDFKGVGRRWQVYGIVNDCLIVDDYAHHPTEIHSTLLAAKATGRRVRAVFQPHRVIRTANQWPEMAEAVSLADEIVVLDIYAANEQALEHVSSELIVKRLESMNKQVHYSTIDQAIAYCAESLAARDLIITLGAGDVWKVADGIMQVAQAQGSLN